MRTSSTDNAGISLLALQKENANCMFCVCSFFCWTFILFSYFQPLVWGRFECDDIEEEERQRRGWICNCESSCKYLNIPFHRRHSDLSLIQLPQSVRSSSDTCPSLHSLRTVPVAQTNVSADGNIGQKDLSHLIVPHCLDPQAYYCKAVVYYCDFLTGT